MKCLWIMLSSLLLLAPVVASADTLLVESINQAPANSANGVLRPARGLTTTRVEQQFGAPSEKLAPVGEPPITRWRYPDYTVYFDRGQVLTSVIKR